MMLVFVLLFVLRASNAVGQVTHSSEIEFGTDGLGGAFVSDYIMLDGTNANAFVRPFWVNNTLTRIEFSLGPTFKTGRLTHKLSFGGTTDRELIIGGVWLMKVADRQIIGIADFKPALGDTTTGPSSKINGRYEQLYLKGIGVVFIRPGVEYQIQFSVHKVPAHVYIAPFYDPKLRRIGGQVGFRFFDLKFH
jgi:hypothetical protein